jgi:hypothetical protein
MIYCYVINESGSLFKPNNWRDMQYKLIYQQAVIFKCKNDKAAKILLKNFKEDDHPFIDVGGSGIEEGTFSYRSCPKIKVVSFRRIKKP